MYGTPGGMKLTGSKPSQEISPPSEFAKAHAVSAANDDVTDHTFYLGAAAEFGTVNYWLGLDYFSATTINTATTLTGNMSVKLSDGLVAVLPVSGGALEVLTTRFTLKILFIIFIVYILTKALIQILCYN